MAMYKIIAVTKSGHYVETGKPDCHTLPYARQMRHIVLFETQLQDWEAWIIDLESGSKVDDEHIQT